MEPAKLTTDLCTFSSNTRCNNFLSAVQEAYDTRRIYANLLYWTLRGADNWIQLCFQADYQLYKQAETLFMQITPELDEIMCSHCGTATYSIVSLGPGAGKVDAIFLNWLCNKRADHDPLKYIAFDISYGLLVETLHNIKFRFKLAGPDFHSKVSVHLINADFSSLASFKNVIDIQPYPNNTPKLILFLGGTFGNFHEDLLVRDLYQVMHPNDALLIGVDCYDQGLNLNSLKQKHEKLEIGRKFLIEPLYEIARIHSPSLPNQPNPDDVKANIKEYESAVKDSYSVIHTWGEELDSQYQLSMSHKYKIDELEKYLQYRRFTRKKIWLYKDYLPIDPITDTYYTLILLAKSAPKNTVKLAELTNKFSKRNEIKRYVEVLWEYIRDNSELADKLRNWCSTLMKRLEEPLDEEMLNEGSHFVKENTDISIRPDMKLTKLMEILNVPKK